MPASEFTLHLLRAAFWSPAPLAQALPEGFLEVASGPPDIGFVPPLLRRRLSPLGRGLLHGAGRVAGDLPEVRSVFASQHGDVARTLPILRDLAHGLEASPTQFSMSVHNASAGIWSIVREDRSASTSVAAGYETFGWGLLEAFALHQAHGGAPILFLYGDDPLPELLTEFEPLQAPLHSIALLLGRPAQRHLVVRREGPGGRGPADQPQSLHALSALGGIPQAEAWPGRSGAWSWQLTLP